MIPAMLAAIAVVSYLLGSLNGAVIASKYVFHRDVREYGSGNAGLTNFYRTFGTPGLLIVLGTDVVKSLIAVLIGGAVMGIVEYPTVGKLFAGFCLMLGHIYPVFYGFRGGKGVVCAAVTLLCVDIRLGHALCVARQHLRGARRAAGRLGGVRRPVRLAVPVLHAAARHQAPQQHPPSADEDGIQTGTEKRLVQ